jgi:mannose-1-phosphate guanylyltransferase/mannose-6-phosphate isomerase
MMPVTIPVILSGGSGTRLWPVSRRDSPKQLHALIGDQTLLQTTEERFSELGTRTIVIANHEHLAVIERQLPSGRARLLVGEPAARNTAPAVAAAALLSQPEEILLVLPADHHFRDQTALHKAIGQGLAAAQDGYLVTFGIVPTKIETGYGHIVPGDAVSNGHRIARFVEKPDAESAADLMANGAMWNSGMFAFRVELVLAELERYRPGLVDTVRDSLPRRVPKEGEIELGPAFANAELVSIDVAVMEATDHGLVVRLDAGWSDLGSWASLWELGDADERGNVVRGKVIDLGSKGSYLRSDGPLVAAIDLEDLVVVATSDAVLVARRDSTQDVKKIVEMLDAEDAKGGL